MAFRTSPTAALGMVVALGLAATLLPAAPGAARTRTAEAPGPYSGGPTHYFRTSEGVEIALAVVLPDGYEKGKRYPTIFEMAGYENASVSPEGRTMLGQTKDAMCENSPDPEACHARPDPPLADDTHRGTSAFRYDKDYVTVHANLPGTGCSSASSLSTSEPTRKPVPRSSIASSRSSDGRTARSGSSVIPTAVPPESWSHRIDRSISSR